jgi:hypothetical protein
MKIEKVNDKKSEFKPIVLNITIESIEEYNSILEMTSFDVSIPNLLDDVYRKDIREFLENLRTEIYK